jgi:hypothetical protein
MFAGINIAGAGFGPVGTEFNGVVQTGAMHLRAASSSQLRNNLANGNYQALANSLSTLNYSQAGGRNAALPEIPQGENGAVLRLNGFPENFIKTNPQFGGVTMNTNMGRTNYHGLQSQVTLRPTVGVNFQASYTWSKLLGLNAGSSCSTCASVSYTNPADREGDYTNQVGDRRHSFLTNGTFHLPVGPGQLLAGNSSGILARVIEGWQTSWILNMSSGAPANILAQNMLYSNGVPDRVGPFDPSAGRVQWEDGAIAGGYFGNAYTTVDDPQCGAIAASLRSFCSLNAVADASGNIVLQNPQPGTRGNLGQNVLELPGTWSLDAAMSKEFQIGETRSLQFRLDALNLFNHPQPANPVLNINSDTAFGNIASKSGTRQFQFMMRLEF